jgi:hypothetical protein
MLTGMAYKPDSTEHVNYTEAAKRVVWKTFVITVKKLWFLWQGMYLPDE